MQIFLRILIGIAIAGGGTFMVIRTQAMLNTVGHIDWAERKLGGGGSILVYKTTGILLCFIGIIVAANLWDAFLNATLGFLISR